MRVSLFLDRFYPKVSPDDLLTHARAIMRDLALRILPVVGEDGALLGIIHRKHILMLSSTKSNALVRDVMDSANIIFKPNEDAKRAFQVMVEFNEWYAPVASEQRNKYLGVLSIDSLLREVRTQKLSTHSLNVEKALMDNIDYVTQNDFISKLWRKMLRLNYSGFPVVKSRRSKVVVGVITQHDLLKKGYTRIELESESGPRHGSRVKEAMTSPAIVIKPYNKVLDAVNILVKNDIGRLPVVNDRGELIGMVDKGSISKLYLSRW